MSSCVIEKIDNILVYCYNNTGYHNKGFYNEILQ